MTVERPASVRLCAADIVPTVASCSVGKALSQLPTPWPQLELVRGSSMNTIKEIQQLNEEELKRGISFKGSWHWQYRASSWVYVGGLDQRLSIGDVICVFSQ
jgi:hypothetical protein